MPPSLELILGPMLMGTIVNVFLFGIMVVQCYLYYLWYKKDRMVIKFTVYFLLLLDTVSSAFDIEMAYQYLVLSFGNLEKIGAVNLGVTPYPFLSGLTTLVVQTFFAWRVSVLTNFKWLSLGICVLSVIQFLASIGVTIGGSIVQQLAALGKLQSVALTWLVVGAATDLLITFVLVFHLRNRRTGFSVTDDVISRIVRWTIQTGVLTSACALAVVIAYLVSESSMHLAFGIPLSKLYTNTLLSTLNVRRGWNTSGYTTLRESNQHSGGTSGIIPGKGNVPRGTFLNLSGSGVTVERTVQVDGQQLSKPGGESQYELGTVLTGGDDNKV